MAHCLDSWAVIAWLDGDEPAAGTVETVLKQGRPSISWVNLVEVEYRISRDHGADEASRTIAELRPLVLEDLPGISTMRAVAKLKAIQSIALADCFAITTAAANDAELLTGDPEILALADELPCGVTDVRRSAGRGSKG